MGFGAEIESRSQSVGKPSAEAASAKTSVRAKDEMGPVRRPILAPTDLPRPYS